MLKQYNKKLEGVLKKYEAFLPEHEIIDGRNYSHKEWKYAKVLHKTYKRIRFYIEYEYSTHDGSITKMFPYEVWLLHNGYDLMHFCALNAYSPGNTLFVKQGKISFDRFYKHTKTGKIIFMLFGFGMTKTFWVCHDKDMTDAHQMPLQEEHYVDVTNGTAKTFNVFDFEYGKY